MDEAVIPEIISEDKLKEYDPNISNKKALIMMSQDPSGLQVFIDKNEKGKLKHKVNVVKCIDLYMKGVSLKDIAATQGLNGSNDKVLRWLGGFIKKYKPDIDRNQLSVFKEFRTEFLQQKQKELLDGITPKKIAVASLKDIAFAQDKLFANERLNEDKSTQNVAHKYSSLVEEIHSRREEDGE